MILDGLTTHQIQNVFLYVGDAVRYDYLPAEITNMGVDAKCIAGSIHSPTSFATIVTGLHFPQHGVADFTDKLTAGLPHLFSNSSHKTAFCNTINHPPFNTNPESESILATTLNTVDSPSDVLETISSPFVVMERGPGGHAPYGKFDGNGTEYFAARSDASRDILADEYSTAISDDIDWFRSQVSTLKERGLAEETLIIYASDHGELLGETGMVGHNGPIHRRLVETPCVFIHPSLRNRTVTDNIVRHVDLLPTIVDIADVNLDVAFDPPGRALASENPGPVGASYYRNQIAGHNTMVPSLTLSYDSVWDSTGGYIFPRTNRFARMCAAIGSLATGPKSGFRRNHSLATISGFLSGTQISGTPQFSLQESQKYLSQIASMDMEGSSEKVAVPQQRLRELGYLE